MKKKLGLILLIIASCAFLVACGKQLTKEVLLGTWNAEYEYNGSDIQIIQIFREDGTYDHVSFIDGRLYEEETGRYQIRKNKVSLYKGSNNKLYMDFHYVDGYLENGDHFWHKE